MVGRIPRWSQRLFYNLLPLSLCGTCECVRHHSCDYVIFDSKSDFADVIEYSQEPLKGTGLFLEKAIWSMTGIWCKRHSFITGFKDGGFHAANDMSSKLEHPRIYSRQGNWDLGHTVTGSQMMPQPCELRRGSWDPHENTAQLTPWF